MKFLRHLLGITKLDKEKNQCIREKTRAQNIVKEIRRDGGTNSTLRTKEQGTHLTLNEYDDDDVKFIKMIK